MMKKVLLTFALTLAVAGVQAADITPIVNAFKEGNVTLISGNMDAEVEIAVPGNAHKGAGTEVNALLNQFFKENKPAAFTVAHHADKGETGFLVGKLSVGNGAFRVNITYCVKNNKVLIQSIRIE
jgi:hypothetical protein